MLDLLLAVTEQIYKSSTPFEWISQHLQLIGWPSLVLLAWQVSRIFTKWTARITKAEHHIHKMATNEMPHMQRTLINIDKNIARFTDGDPVDFTGLDEIEDKPLD